MVRINSDKMIKNPGKRFFAGHQSGEEALPGNSYVNSYVMAETACGQAEGRPAASRFYLDALAFLICTTFNYFRFFVLLLSITSGSSGGSSGVS